MAGGDTQLARLLEHPAIWRGRSAAQRTGLATGFAPLDEHLPGRGWPRTGLIEILVSRFGSGELALLLPALAALTRARCARWCVWVDPPLVPFGPGRARHGARAGGRRDRHTPPVGFRAGAALGGLRRGARLDAASAAARTAPPAARRRVRPYPRGAVSSAALRPRDFRCGAAPGARAARCRSAHHAAERPRHPPR